ncbi:MAG: hypothetical protein KAI24_19035 [Planctomycetes bacterium]|nr:hypothetical protein [Planctomycetota bacterium]
MSRLFPLLLALAPIASAQQSMVDDMNRRFASRSPKVGEPLPDATGFTMTGAPFSLRDTRGKLTVLVTGCLT